MHLPIIEPMFSNTGNPEAQPPSLADIVREETEDGRLIVRFFIDAMQGLLEGFKPCHRLDAARQLSNLGFLQAQSFIDANTPASPTRKNSVPSALSAVKPSPLHQELAALIREETDNGRTTVRFLVDVMQGNIPDFKPHHRLSAAKELLRRGFDTPVHPDAGSSAALTGTQSGPEQSAPAEKHHPGAPLLDPHPEGPLCRLPRSAIVATKRSTAPLTSGPTMTRNTTSTPKALRALDAYLRW